MRVGVVARAEDRGLGIQTWEVCRALRPDRVLVVDMEGSNAGYAQHFDRYINLGLPTTIVPHADMGNPRVVGAWCRGLDVVYSAETFYRWQFCDIARDVGARTVVHLNPEFYKHAADDVHEPAPDAWWAPTPWLRDHPSMPPTTLMPMPVPYDRWTDDDRASVVDPGRTTFVHPGGHPAALDRNGTRLLFMALRYVTEPMSVLVLSQLAHSHRPAKIASRVMYRSVLGGVRDYWTWPLMGDVAVIPRRYGGLCLPALEAAGAGRALIMSDTPPNDWYPADLVAGGTTDVALSVGLGMLSTYEVTPRALAAAMDRLAGDTAARVASRARAAAWARDHSWEAVVDDWWAQLAAVAAT